MSFFKTKTKKYTRPFFEPYLGSPVIHNPAVQNGGVRCAQCSICPIVGIRYKCTVRKDFYLCANCESKETPLHPMMKLYSPVAAITTATTTTVRCIILLPFLCLWLSHPLNRLFAISMIGCCRCTGGWSIQRCRSIYISHLVSHYSLCIGWNQRSKWWIVTRRRFWREDFSCSIWWGW